MVESNNLIGIKYLKDEYFRRGEQDCLLTRSLWFKALNEELEQWNDEKYMNFFPRINRLKLEISYKLLKLGSKIYNSSKNRKIMWIGELSNKNFLYESQPYNLIISDMRLSLNALIKLLFTKNISLDPIYPCYNSLNSGIVNEDEELLQNGLDILKNTLNAINPDLIVLNNDVFPINRAVILVARELGIPTVEIQHGIYVRNFTPTGREVDYVFVWGNRFKEFYVENKIKKSNQVKILGYPYPIQKCGSANNERMLVTYIGQNYEVYNESLLSTKLNTLKEINEICNRLNFDFVYRPHPGDHLDLLKPELENVAFTSHDETLHETFEKGDIFISYDSTALVEASLHSKLSIQLKSYDLATDNFENLGACSKTIENFEELEKYLKQVKNGELSSFYRPVKESYIEIPQDIGKKFWELIKEII